jgi:aldose 1-epimerase
MNVGGSNGNLSRTNEEYIIQNHGGMKATLSNYGARLIEFLVPDRSGNLSNVVLGFDTHDEYVENVNIYLGATIGRVAGRIAKSKFQAQGLGIDLIANEHGNHLHGGRETALDRVYWAGKVVREDHSQSVIFTYISPSGEAGYPGELSIEVTYTLTDQNQLIITYRAVTSAKTPINLTNHTYWNLHDSGASDILSHQLRLNSDQIITMDSQLLPIGGFSSVSELGMDFSTLRPISQALPNSSTEPWPGIDNTFVIIDAEIGKIKEAATLYDPASGRKMTITTTETSVQVYTANRMDTIKGRNGVIYSQGNSICLEAQRVVDSHLLPDLPTIVLNPNEEYVHKTIHTFSID